MSNTLEQNYLQLKSECLTTFNNICAMKEIMNITPDLRNRMHSFGRTIRKRQPFYRLFSNALHHDFAKIIEDDLNKCVCCGQVFKGKSIGPHYKNSKKCADFKKKLKGERAHRGTLKPSDANQLLEEKLKREDGIKEESDGDDIFLKEDEEEEEEDLHSMNIDVDDFFFYSDEAE